MHRHTGPRSHWISIFHLFILRGTYAVVSEDMAVMQASASLFDLLCGPRSPNPFFSRPKRITILTYMLPTLIGGTLLSVL